VQKLPTERAETSDRTCRKKLQKAQESKIFYNKKVAGNLQFEHKKKGLTGSGPL